MKRDFFCRSFNDGLIEEKNPLKQGLKQNLVLDSLDWLEIEEKNPLKQGLKPGDTYTGEIKHID